MSRVLQAQVREDYDFNPNRRSLPICLFDQNGDPINLGGDPFDSSQIEADITELQSGLTVVEGAAAANGTAIAAIRQVPTGGSTDQYLKKNSGTNGDTGWATLPAIPASVVYRKTTAASATVPSGTNVEDTGAKVSFTLAATRLCLLIGRAGHSDPPNSHTFDWALDGTSFGSAGNNSAGVSHYATYSGNGGATTAAAAESQGATALGGGHWRVLGSGAHVWSHRTTRGSAGGTMQDRTSIVVVFDLAITDQ